MKKSTLTETPYNLIKLKGLCVERVNFLNHVSRNENWSN